MINISREQFESVVVEEVQQLLEHRKKDLNFDILCKHPGLLILAYDKETGKDKVFMVTPDCDLMDQNYESRKFEDLDYAFARVGTLRRMPQKLYHAIDDQDRWEKIMSEFEIVSPSGSEVGLIECAFFGGSKYLDRARNALIEYMDILFGVLESLEQLPSDVRNNRNKWRKKREEIFDKVNYKIMDLKSKYDINTKPSAPCFGEMFGGSAIQELEDTRIFNKLFYWTYFSLYQIRGLSPYKRIMNEKFEELFHKLGIYRQKLEKLEKKGTIKRTKARKGEY